MSEGASLRGGQGENEASHHLPVSPAPGVGRGGDTTGRK